MEKIHKSLVTKGILKEDPPPTKGKPQVQQDIHCTHYGNGLRFIHRYGKNVRYCPPFDWWFVWNEGEGRWARDEMSSVYEMGKETVLHLYGEAEAAAIKERRKELAEWAMKCEKPTSVNMLLDSAKTDALITVHFSVFDPDPMVLNLKNGFYNFRSNTFHPHDRTQYFSMLVPGGV
jgi:putative DNA primase/helicase